MKNFSPILFFFSPLFPSRKRITKSKTSTAQIVVS